MKIYLRLFMLSVAAFGVTSLVAQAQIFFADSTVLNPLAHKIQGYINQNQIDSLYALTTDQFKQRRSLERVKAETLLLREKLGQWKSMEFKEIENGVAYYKATFDKGISTFNLGLGKDKKIESIGFSLD